MQEMNHNSEVEKLKRVNKIQRTLLFLVCGTLILVGAANLFKYAHKMDLATRENYVKTPNYHVILIKDDQNNITDIWKYNHITYSEDSNGVLRWYEDSSPFIHEKMTKQLGQTNCKYSIVSLGADKKKFDTFVEFHQ